MANLFQGFAPTAPDSLVRPIQKKEEVFSSQTSVQVNSTTAAPVATSNIAATPRSVDGVIYQQAIDERKQAEMHYAEIYSKYLELVAFNEKILRQLHRLDIYL